ISMFQNDASFLPSAKDGSVKIIESHSCRYYRLLRNENFINRFVSKLRFYNDGRIIKRYDAFVTLTDEDKKDWPDYDNIHVIPDPMTIRCNEKAHLSGKRVIAVGRFSYEKGYDNLVKAWTDVERRHPDWELLIIGSQDDTAYVNYIKNLIEESGLKRIFLRPSTNAIEKEYLNSNMLVLTSNFEGFGLVLTEAMSVGLPLVSFNTKCGPSDIIKDGENGFLVRDKNTEVFADRVCRLIEDKELQARMSTKSIEYSKLYDVDNIMAQWTSLFDELMASKK
ncbi:MAG: glycosyltransferase, partial [Muribaculaceae bacterium]|nr:glycosyltransferase [Muribaculaceae bacterium]